MGAGLECRVFRILPHVVCGNCGILVSKEADACPFCETPINQSDINCISTAMPCATMPKKEWNLILGLESRILPRGTTSLSSK